MLETMKLLGSTKSEINKNENGENGPNLEITEVILLIIIIKEIEESCIHLFLISRLVNYHIFFKKKFPQNLHILKCALQIKILIL